MRSQTAFSLVNVSLSYGDHRVIDRCQLDIDQGSFTAIIGPNGCGKSTLLRAMSRLMSPCEGHILCEGEDLYRISPRQAAQRVALLSQSAQAPSGITVAQLVGRGRYPHQDIWHRFSKADRKAVNDAMERTEIADLADRSLDSLSGGQRQRVWVAMALCQETRIVLLDEPTTYLDIAHQIQLMDLFTSLHREGRTIVAVLHDLNQAARYAETIVALSRGKIVAHGKAREVITSENIEKVYGLRSVIADDPQTNTPMVIPCTDQRW